MANPFEKKPSSMAAPQTNMTHISARLSSKQLKVFRQFGVRNDKTAQQMILSALAAMIPDFPT